MALFPGTVVPGTVAYGRRGGSGGGNALFIDRCAIIPSICK